MNVFRLHLDGGGEQHWQLYQQPFLLGTAGSEQAPFIAVEIPAYDAHAAVAHCRSHLVGTEILRRLRHIDGTNEALYWNVLTRSTIGSITSREL